MEPGGELVTMWDEYSGQIIAFTEGETTAYQTLQQYRAGLEALVGDTYTGECLIAAAKMCISAFVVGAPNPYVAFYDEREEMHDDIHPLAYKALGLLHEAKLQDPFDPTVTLDRSRPEKLEDAMQQNFMRGLIDQAVRPEDD